MSLIFHSLTLPYSFLQSSEVYRTCCTAVIVKHVQDRIGLPKLLDFVAGHVAQMQSSMHQERLQRQEQAALYAELETHKQQMQHRCHDVEAKLKVSLYLMCMCVCVYMPICCTPGKLM